MSNETTTPETADPAAPWSVQRMGTRVIGRDAIFRFKRTETVTTPVSVRLRARAERAIAEFQQGDVAKKYQLSRQRLLDIEAELHEAKLAEARADIAYRRAVSLSDEQTVERLAGEFEAVRAAVADLTIRRDSIRDAATACYAAAIQNFKTVGEGAFSDARATAHQDYEAALQKISKAISEPLDELIDASHRRDQLLASISLAGLPPVDHVVPPLPAKEREQPITSDYREEPFAHQPQAVA